MHFAAILASAATVLMSSAAIAADPPVYDPGPVDANPVSYWDGFYIGIIGGAGTDTPAAVSSFYNLGVAGGVSGTAGSLYFGAEGLVALETFNGGDPYFWLELDGQLGFVVADRVVLYGLAGVAYDAGANETVPVVGAGVTVAVTENLSGRLGYAREFYAGGLAFHEVKLGAFWHLD